MEILLLLRSIQQFLVESVIMIWIYVNGANYRLHHGYFLTLYTTEILGRVASPNQHNKFCWNQKIQRNNKNCLFSNLPKGKNMAEINKRQAHTNEMIKLKFNTDVSWGCTVHSNNKILVLFNLKVHQVRRYIYYINLQVNFEHPRDDDGRTLKLFSTYSLNWMNYFYLWIYK